MDKDESRRGGRTFCGLGLKGQPDGFSERNIFDDSYTEKGAGSGKDIFEGGFKFATYEARKYFDTTALSFQREEDRSSSPCTQRSSKLGVKLKHRVN